MSNKSQNQTWTVDTKPDVRSINDIELSEFHLKPILKFVVALFDDIPIRFRDLVTLFVLRTVILVPLIAGMTHLVNALGLL